MSERGRRGNPELGKWDYDGEFVPDNADRPYHRCKTFSVGIFQWVESEGKPHWYWEYIPTRGGCTKTLVRRIKPGKAICRVRGLTSEPGMVYEMAEEICKTLDGMSDEDRRIFAAYHRKSYTAERRAKRKSLPTPHMDGKGVSDAKQRLATPFCVSPAIRQRDKPQ